MEVIHSVIAVISTKNVDTSTMHDCRVSVTRAWWLRAAICIELTPSISRKVEAEEVISAISAIIAAKNVKIVVHCN